MSIYTHGDENERQAKEIAELEAETNTRCACHHDPEGKVIAECAGHRFQRETIARQAKIIEHLERVLAGLRG